MNNMVKETQNSYRAFREEKSFSILDIPEKMNQLAIEGKVWMIKEMEDISEGEKILLEYYYHKYWPSQIYDNLEDFHPLPSSKLVSTNLSCQTSQKNISIKKQLKKQRIYLEVKNVKLFSGYKKAKELEEKIIELCNSFPSYELGHIVDQILRSSRSIKERIEIGEQIYVREKFNQYSIAIGSAKETSTWLQISLSLNYITQEQFDRLDNQVTQIVSILTRTLINIREREGSDMDLPNPYTPDVRNYNAYKEALMLVEKIYDLTGKREFWKEKHLVLKTRAKATSCIANIAESNQLYIDRKFSFINDALEALNGLDSLLDTSLCRGIISEDSKENIKKLRISIRNILLKTLGNMSKRKAS